MSQQKKFMVSPRALQLAQNNYDISNASSAKPSPKLPQTRTLDRTTSCNHGRYRYERRTPSPSQQPQTVHGSSLTIMVSGIGDRDGAVHLEDDGGREGVLHATRYTMVFTLFFYFRFLKLYF